jgi:hypothetical protein
MSDDERFFKLCERFEQHVERFEKHEQREAEKFDMLIQSMQTNTDTVGEICKQVSQLTQDTRDVIQLHRDFKGAARLGKGAQGFFLWLLKWGAIGAGLVAIGNWLLDHFSS